MYDFLGMSMSITAVFVTVCTVSVSIGLGFEVPEAVGTAYAVVLQVITFSFEGPFQAQSTV